MRVLIVGQGIAGTLLHWQFFKSGINAHVVDNHWKNASSTGAAGLFNPIVFKRFVMAWRAAEFLPAAMQVYRELEKHFNTNLIHELPYAKVFAHPDDPQSWAQRCATAPFSTYMKEQKPNGLEELPLKKNFGVGTVTGTGWIDLPTMLSAYNAMLHEQGLLFLQDFTYKHLIISNNKVLWNDAAYDLVVFCEGHKGISNPWFNHLPLRRNKGETLWLKCDGLPVDYILNRNVFVVPLIDGQHRIGSTYDWKAEDDLASETGKAFLEQKFKELVDLPYEVTAQWAGIRPAVSDRRPLLGRHPLHPQLAIFNGLGTRGVMNAPMLSRELVDNLMLGVSLHPEADIRRFSK